MSDYPSVNPFRPYLPVLRHPVVRLTVVALLVLGLILVGGGWYFAGRIESQALAVGGGAPLQSAEAGAVDADSLTINVPADAPSVLVDDTRWGVSWHGGYGQVSGDPRPGPGGTTVRDLQLLEGDLPAARAMLVPDRDAFPDSSPELAVGRPVREVTYAAALGDTPAWFASPAGGGDTWAVLVHGKGAERSEMLRLMHATVGAGLPSLAIGYRNDDDAPADGTGRYHYGATEWEDLAAAVEHAHARGAERVVLVGASMGGAVIASYLEHTPDAPVDALVLDSPMLDLSETIRHGAEQTAFPLVGHVPAPLTWTATRVAGLRYDVDWSDVDYLDDSSWLTVPTLVVHGDADPTVPVSVSRTLAAAHPDLVDLEVVAGAAHVASWNEDPAAYDQRVRTFLTSH